MKKIWIIDVAILFIVMTLPLWWFFPGKFAMHKYLTEFKLALLEKALN